MYKSIRISDEDYSLVTKIAKKDDRKYIQIISYAIRNLAKAKKIIK